MSRKRKRPSRRRRGVGPVDMQIREAGPDALERPAGPLGRRPKPTSAAEAEFLAIGDGARTWLVEAAAAGTSRMKVKMAQAVTLARLHGTERLDWALGCAAMFGRFADGDLASILAADPTTSARR